MTAETQQRRGDAPAWSPGRPQLGLVKLLVPWLLTPASLLAPPGSSRARRSRASGGALLVTAVVGVLNAFLPPLIAAVRLPFALILGFLVADAAMLMAADALTEGTIKLDSSGRRSWLRSSLPRSASHSTCSFGTNDDQESRPEPDPPARRRSPGSVGLFAS
jgi:uncharacterized membrane protein YvlD (DUF360 family)